MQGCGAWSYVKSSRCLIRSIKKYIRNVSSHLQSSRVSLLTALTSYCDIEQVGTKPCGSRRTGCSLFDFVISAIMQNNIEQVLFIVMTWQELT